MLERPHHRTATAIAPDPLLLGVCAWIALGGVLAAALSNVVGSVLVPDYDWVADTISDLAAGRYEIVQDVGLYAYGAALLAGALGAAHCHTGTPRWTAGVLSLALMAALVVVIGARNEYGDSDARATWGVHLGMVYALMLLFLATTLVMAPGMGRRDPRYLTGASACAALFVVTAVIYLLSPNGYDGLTERVVVLVTMAWLAMVAHMLLALRRAARG